MGQAIADAKAKLGAAKVSADGSDVDPAETWVTQQARDALAAAIADAQAVLDLAGDFEVKLAATTPDSVTVTNATEALTSAATGFLPKAGTKQSGEIDPAKNGGQVEPSQKTESGDATPQTDDGYQTVTALAVLLSVSALGAAVASRRKARSGKRSS